MNSSIRTFRAATAEEALAQVRREMGLEAVVVEVNEVSSGGLFNWLSRRPQYEVKASRPAAGRKTSRASSPAAQTVAPSTHNTIAAAAASARGAAVSQASIPVEPDPANSSSGSRQQYTTGIDGVPAAPCNRIAGRMPGVAHPAGLPGSAPRNAKAMDRECPAALDLHAVPRTEAGIDGARPLEQRMDSLQQMIADLGRRPQPRGLIEIPPELFPHYLTLVEADVEEETARGLIQKLHRHSSPEHLANSAMSMALLTALIEQQIACASALVPAAGRRQIAMVVGPTGVGKTTTLAKLAGRFGIRQDCRLGLITVDTYRVAAVEQLRTYAEIIDLPMRVVANRDEMHTALDSLAHCDLVLIDTAGRSPRDDHQLAELKELVDAACPDHVFLVLSLASGTNALRAAAKRFAAVHPTSLVFTKLDEAIGCGGLLSAARDIGLPISYFTTGQEVPRDIEPANPCRAARLILGSDSVTRKAP